jgi:hypothetical protein
MSEALDPSVSERLRALPPISLEELRASAELHVRRDRKYIVTWSTAAAVVEALRGSHRVLEIEGERSFLYDTVYFDTPSLGAYRAHRQRRRKRYKARTRRYVESDLHFFEVKLKGLRGQTIKHQLPYPASDHGTLTFEAAEFLDARLAEAYPNVPVPELHPTLRTEYRRITLVGSSERVTFDYDLMFSDGERELAGLEPGHVIIETKTERGLGTADRELRGLGLRPLRCSKYCAGIGMLRDDVKTNDLRWLLGRYFRPLSPPLRPTGHAR